ncbi:SMTN (predicted) [Pycnogonum litorale]
MKSHISANLSSEDFVIQTTTLKSFVLIFPVAVPLLLFFFHSFSSLLSTKPNFSVGNKRVGISGIKDMILNWCQSKTKEYENIKITNFSSSWANGLAFCALTHHFYPDAFDYHSLQPENRRENFDLAFQMAEDFGGVCPLLETDDMIMMKDKPDWKCVFTYVQSLYQKYRNLE